ncbi:MAG: PTS sugar transporter subunit IIB [Solobacterium sp.]|nr:PTS sugar transporter subunit IIB [Solobacterium sp.]
MKKILLLCGAGISTSILLNKLEEAAAMFGDHEYEFEATTIEQADKYVPEADVVLVAPQISFQIGSLQRRFPEARFSAMDMHMFGMIDGAAIIALAERTIEESENE